jgi:hypothetical protein
MPEYAANLGIEGRSRMIVGMEIAQDTERSMKRVSHGDL